MVEHFCFPTRLFRIFYLTIHNACAIIRNVIKDRHFCRLALRWAQQYTGRCIYEKAAELAKAIFNTVGWIFAIIVVAAIIVVSVGSKITAKTEAQIGAPEETVEAQAEASEVAVETQTETDAESEYAYNRSEEFEYMYYELDELDGPSWNATLYGFCGGADLYALRLGGYGDIDHDQYAKRLEDALRERYPFEVICVEYEKYYRAWEILFSEPVPGRLLDSALILEIADEIGLEMLNEMEPVVRE